MSTPPPVAGQLSPDGNWFWNGREWQPALSPDWQWRWNGSQWLPTAAVGPGQPMPLPPGVVAPATRPTTYWFFLVYCVLIAVLLVVVLVALGVQLAKGSISGGATAGAIAGMVICAVGAAAYGVAPFLPRKRWVWIYGIVLLVVGILGLGGIFAIVLLIFWTRERNQAYYRSG